MKTNLMIKIRALSLSIHDKTLLQNISFDVAEGDHLAVVGPNGSGKSTLLRLLVGILSPSQGEILLHGKSMQAYSQRQLARLISYVPQNSGRQLPFQVEDFVKMARYPYHTALSDWLPEDQQAVEDAFRITNTAPFRQRQMTTLSGGECQRVMIAAALCQQTPIMILDEPTSYLDPHHQVEVHQLIHRLNQQHGITVIEVSHDINHASQHSQQVLALKQGERLWFGASEDFLQADLLKALYNQDFVFVPHPHSGRNIALPAQS
ncbi:ABC transporter ATP-binding protein [Methylophaga sp. OBS4]|uniref:ABC transporter ATP-binding protein n=1 Tax=Methylophaga sp. OBS4 TaxID=2991935 RepID=UPI00225B602D|nr:ABC transporter ATP-binding protein [Methylophaga sp. OBS4]MCX4188197.1 ABC transporter ATP-binding protein [Methylophaga sp. OBS4]